MAVTIHKLDTPTNVVATIQVGGNLAPNITYYVRITARYPYNWQTSIPSSFPYMSSEASIEISFTTDATNLSAQLDWDAVAGAGGYNVYISTISGDYSNTGYGYGRRCNNASWYSVTATNSYTVTDDPLPSGDRVLTSMSLDTFTDYYYPITLPYHIPLSAGVVGIQISGTVTLQDIADELSAQGLTDYYYFDVVKNFAIKGSIYVVNGDTGSLDVSSFNILLIQGIIKNQSSSFTMTLGKNSGSYFPNNIIYWDVYGGKWDFANQIATSTVFIPNSVGKIFYPLWFPGFGAVVNINDNIQDCNFLYVSNYNADVSNQKWYFPYGRFRTWALRDITNTDLNVGFINQYTRNGRYSFYDSKIKINGTGSGSTLYHISMTSYPQTYTEDRLTMGFYDCEFGGDDITSYTDYKYYWGSSLTRSEERRVGKECRSRWSPYP